jgi:predicted phage-related endonuclease
MIHHNLKQGTPAWHIFRAKHFGASDSPPMMNESPYKTRNELLFEKYSGLQKDVDDFTEQLFAKGHHFEGLSLTLAEQEIEDDKEIHALNLSLDLAEEMIGSELYPVVGSNGIYSASFDGLTMFEDTGYEHKMLNDAIRACKTAADLPLLYRIQCEHQLMVSAKTERILFGATQWDENDQLVDKKFLWYYHDSDLRQQIIDGWRQFKKDLDSYTYVEPKVEVIGRAPETLPALLIEVKGSVVASNLIEFREQAFNVLRAIKTDLQTDEDFANADKTVKWCKNVESRLEAAKEHALAQTQSIDEIFRTMDEIREEARQKRLTLDKIVARQKEHLRFKKCEETRVAFLKYVAELQNHIEVKLDMALPIFANAIKGLKTLTSIQNALDAELAKAKIEADNLFNDMSEKLKVYKKEADQYSFLFPDLNHIIKKPMQDFVLTIQYRIGQSKIIQTPKTVPVDVLPPASIPLVKKEKISEHDQTKQMIQRFIDENEFSINKQILYDALLNFFHFLKDQKIFN